MGGRFQDSAIRNHSVKDAIQSVQEIARDLEFMLPLEFFMHLAAGYDPRKGNPLLEWLRRKVSKLGRPKRLVLSERDTERLYILLRLAVNFDDVELSVSQRAAEKLAEFMYPKQKMIESTNMSGVVIEAPGKIARRAMKALVDKMKEDY